MNVVHRYESGRHLVLKTREGGYLPDLDDFNETVLGLKRQALRDMRGEGFESEKIDFSLELEIAGPAGSRLFESPRLLIGSPSEVEEICAACTGRFDMGRNDPIEAAVFRLIASAPVQHYQFPSHDSADPDPGSARKGRRKVYWEDRFVETDIYEQNLLRSGNIVVGPAIIESEDTTVLVPPRQRYAVDQYLNGCLTGA
jgi:N-methylhydantoinase A/acetophenone carboxylase